MELISLRKEKKLTQEQVAKYLNMSQSTYQHYENGRAEPSIETLCKLADLYNVSLDQLVGRKYLDDIGYLSNNQKKLVYIIKQLNDEELDAIQLTALKLIDKNN